MQVTHYTVYRNNYDSLKCAKEKYARVNLNTEFRNPKTTSVFAAIKVNFKIDASVTDGVVHIDDFKETDAKKEE